MKDIVQRKLEQYASRSAEEEESALKEITQEIVLYALSKVRFFEHASFQGGTCLRILHQLDRFSEDLDFALNSPRMDFSLDPYLRETAKIMQAYGFEVAVTGKDRVENAVKMRFLKDESIKKVLVFKHLSDLEKKIKIKVEVDINPPAQAVSEMQFLDFPTDFSILAHDLKSLFSGKLHALLCRSFAKGRDWYDFGWYISQSVSPNLRLLKNAFYQQGPWKNQEIELNQAWIIDQMAEKIERTDWVDVIRDVSPFLRPEKNEEIRRLWGKEFFLAKLRKLKA